MAAHKKEVKQLVLEAKPDSIFPLAENLQHSLIEMDNAYKEMAEKTLSKEARKQ